jgi:hypothetical protein
MEFRGIAAHWHVHYNWIHSVLFIIVKYCQMQPPGGGGAFRPVTLLGDEEGHGLSILPSTHLDCIATNLAYKKSATGCNLPTENQPCWTLYK